MLVQRRTAGPTVAHRIIDLQHVCCVGTEYSLQPRCYSFPRRRRRCRRSSRKGIASGKYPQLTADYSRPGNVDSGRQIGSRCPTVSRNVVVIQRVEIRVIDVAATSDVDVSVDDAEARSSQRGRHAGAASIPRIRNRIILPHLPKGGIHVASAISTYQVDLPVEVSRTHEGSYIRHRRSSAPGIGGDIVDAGGIDDRAGGGIVATEDEELVDVGRIHARGLGVGQIWHRGERCPSVSDRVKLPELVDGATGREGVTTSLIGKGAIAVDEAAVMIYGYRRCLRPGPGTASWWACRAVRSRGVGVGDGLPHGPPTELVSTMLVSALPS